jgi:nuclear transcription Y subunit beta
MMSDNPDSDSRLKGIRGAGPSAASGSDDSAVKEQDCLLPIANVGRIMKQILPPNAKISKEAKETMQECVSEFISFVTGEASDKCRKEKRKTVNGDDVCWALNTLGFDDYVETMRRYLQKYRETEGDRAAASGGNIRDDVRGEQGHFMFNAMARHNNSSSSSRRQF